jgi:hypothetical protein
MEKIEHWSIWLNHDFSSALASFALENAGKNVA